MSLLRASEAGNYTDIQRLLDSSSLEVINKARTEDGKTALMLASMGGHVHIVRLLVSNGAAVNRADEVSRVYLNGSV